MFYFRNRSNRSKLLTLRFLSSTLCTLRCRGVRLNKIIRSIKQLNRARFGFGSQHYCKVQGSAAREPTRFVSYMHLLEIPVTGCCFGLQKRDELSYPLQVDGDYAGLQYLKRAEPIFVKWKASGTTGLTNEAFTACIQTINSHSELVKHS